MEINNCKEGSHEESCSLSGMVSSFCSEDRSELNPLQEIFGAQSSSKLVFSMSLRISRTRKKKKDHSNKRNRTVKRKRSMKYRVVMEKKRRQVIKEKVDILHAMTPNCVKTDLAMKLENIAEYIKSLKHQVEVMSMAYTEYIGYMSPFYGAQASCMSPYATPWSYYTPGIPIMTHQNMPFIAKFYQVHDTAA